jgi:hypothetical protein
MSAATNGRVCPARPASRVAVLSGCISVLAVAVGPYALHELPKFRRCAAMRRDGLRERSAEIRQEVRWIMGDRAVISNDLSYLAR